MRNGLAMAFMALNAGLGGAVLGGALGMSAGAAWAEGALPTKAEGEIVQARYLCERGVVIEASYINAGAGHFVVLQAEGRQLALSQAVSASGARYFGAGMGEGAKVSGPVWWSKGDTGTLSWYDAEHSEEVTLYHACAVQA